MEGKGKKRIIRSNSLQMAVFEQLDSHNRIIFTNSLQYKNANIANFVSTEFIEINKLNTNNQIKAMLSSYTYWHLLPIGQWSWGKVIEFFQNAQEWQ